MKNKNLHAKPDKRLIVLLILIIPLILSACSNHNVMNSRQQQYLITGQLRIVDSAAVHRQEPVTATSQQIAINTLPLETPSFNPEEYIIKFNQAVSVDYIKREILRNKGQVMQEISDGTIFKIKLPTPNSSYLIDSIQDNSLISYIEPDYLVFIQTVPNDPEYYRQWNLELLALSKTWNSYRGSADVIVAVLDTGILDKHPDLQGNIIAGYDFIDHDHKPIDTDPEFSHGTHVAGIIGALTNNQLGVAGINWQVKIMPVRIIGPDGSGNYSNLIAGIYWAVDHGANIINLSLAGTANSSSLKEAIEYAIKQGVTVVAAAGNNGTTPILYPARYPEVISVGAVGPTSRRAYYSNYGPNLDLVAPGGDDSVYSFPNTILSTAGYLEQGQKHQYTWAQGTSMATPHVSGLIALLYSVGINDPLYIQELLKSTADDLGQPGTDQEYGAGLININRALNLEDNPPENALLLSQSGIIARKQDQPVKEVLTSSDQQGKFSLQLTPGYWSISAQIDTNKNNQLDQGDYYGKVEELLVEGNRNLTIDLKPYHP